MSSPSVFLSHSSVDKHFARQLASDLTLSGAHVWLDEAEIGIGDSLIAKISEGISDCDYLAAVLSPDSVDSPWVQKELEVALYREIRHKRLVVLPLLYRACHIPTFLQDKLHADFKDSSQYIASLNRLLRRIGLPERPTSQESQQRVRVVFDTLPELIVQALCIVTNKARSDMSDSDLISVRDIDLSNRPTCDYHIEHLQKLPSLSRLVLDETLITDSCSRSFSELSHLEEVMISTPNFTDAGLSALRNLPNIQRLRLGIGISDQSVAILLSLRRLDAVRLFGPGITDTTLLGLAGHPSLTTLILDFTATTEDGRQNLQKRNPQLRIKHTP